jgi:hypothetical protein
MAHAGHLVLEVKKSKKLVAKYEPPQGQPFRAFRHPIICCPTHEMMALEVVASSDRARIVILVSITGECPPDCDYKQASA